MNKRDAINEILLSLNELPLETEDAVEDIQIAQIVDKQLDITKKRILSKGWFFNSSVRDLYPDASGYILIPSAFLLVDAPDDGSITVRDWKLFDKDNLTFIFEESQSCRVIEDIEFDDLPFTVADYIVQTASLQAYINIIGNTDDVRLRHEQVMIARHAALREDANSRDGNVLDHTFVTDLLDRENT